eukprot:1049579-Rhodomonas_salina.1
MGDSRRRRDVGPGSTPPMPVPYIRRQAHCNFSPAADRWQMPARFTKRHSFDADIACAGSCVLAATCEPVTSDKLCKESRTEAKPQQTMQSPLLENVFDNGVPTADLFEVQIQKMKVTDTALFPKGQGN